MSIESDIQKNDKVCKIAIVGSYNHHNECIGFLCENLFNNKYINFSNIVINIYYSSDNYKYIDYFKKLYPSIHIYNKNTHTIAENDIVIKLTSDDPIVHNQNYISILHVISSPNLSNNIITLSPLVNNEIIPFSLNSEYYLQENKLNYIFPFYSGISTTSYKPTIIMIGYYENRYIDDDMVRFIQSLNYNIHIISYNANPYLFSNFKNVTFIPTLSTEDMISAIGESKFILARNQRYMNRDRFTGILTLAISHRKPIILGEYFSKTYNIPAITYNENYCEITDKLNNITDSEYVEEVNKIDDFINTQGEYNKRKMASIINKY